MTAILRFAPSPTGYLHIGNLRTALVTWLAARQDKAGQFILRLDDTDTARSREEYAEAIQEDMAWLGLHWDRLERQSARQHIYEKKIEQLQQEGWLYPCYETAEELALKRKSLITQGRPPIYDRAALSLSDDQRAELVAQGRKPHWRFRLPEGDISWQDHVRGPVQFLTADMSDPVVVREDGRPLYHLCSVIDDGDFGVTLVVRAEDHVANTAAHIAMFQALGFTPPQFAHTPLLTDQDGQGLSKRLGSLAIQDLRRQGLEPMALLSVLGRIGTSDPIEALPGMADLIDSFSFHKFARNSSKFDLKDVLRLNTKYLHEMPYEQVKTSLAEMGVLNIDAKGWQAIRDNLESIQDTKIWWQRIQEDQNGFALLTEEDQKFVREAIAHLPPAPWDEQSWDQWITALKAHHPRKGKKLFLPLRTALTGVDHGPELRFVLPLIGYEKAVQRLSGAKALSNPNIQSQK